MKAGVFAFTHFVAPVAIAMGVVTPALAQSRGLSDAYLLGTWKEDRTCRGPAAMTFDVLTFTIPGQPPLGYRVTGPNEVTLTGSSGSLILTSQYVDADTMLGTFGGSTSTLYRCTSAAAPAPPATFAPVPGYVGGISAAYLSGRWKDNGLCIGKTLMTFDAGGSVIFKGAVATAFTVTGSDSIALSTPSGPLSFTVRYLEPDKIFVDDHKGNTGEAFRCTRTPSGFAAPTPAPPAPYAPPAGALSPAFLYGRWTQNTCAAAATFRPDGILVDSNGTTVGWSFGGNFLTFTTALGVSETLTLRALDANTVERREASGALTLMRRCP